jgi:hypothetical protein
VKDGGPFTPVSNVEIAAAAAPRPQLVVSTGWDWSRNTPSVEYPFLARVYDVLGARSSVENLHLPGEGHEFGSTKRRAVYRFLAERLGLDLTRLVGSDGELMEHAAAVCDRASLCVFDPSHPRPAHALVGAAAVRTAFEDLPRRTGRAE